METFFNTTNENGKQLKQFKQKAEKQENKVLRIFRQVGRGLTASEVWVLFLDKNVPITSIRRAMSNLTRDNILVKTNIKRNGEYGRPETEYQLKTGQLAMFN